MPLARWLEEPTFDDLQLLLSTFRHSTSRALPSAPLPVTPTASSSPSPLLQRTVSTPSASSLPEMAPPSHEEGCPKAAAQDIFRRPSSWGGPPRPHISLSRWLHALDSGQALDSDQACDALSTEPACDNQQGRPLPGAFSPNSTNHHKARATPAAREPRTGLQEQLAAAGLSLAAMDPDARAREGVAAG
ncbi:hypothetical protein T484DRAFT_1756931 [Baffinella frigidus]|nr:hypothetical protein T484DRAFT_1756931 [Cryptophyta sp. CCMP2293]